MNAKVSYIKSNKLKLKQLERAAITALEKTGEQLHTEVVQSQVFPFDTGNLQNESTFVDFTNSKNGAVTIVSNTPYARRLYYHPEYNFSKAENPNARGRWYDDWIDGHKSDRARKIFAKLYKKEAKL